MTVLLRDIKHTIAVKLELYNGERQRLLNAQGRIAELDGLIAEAEAELAAVDARIPPAEEPPEDGVKPGEE